MCTPAALPHHPPRARACAGGWLRACAGDSRRQKSQGPALRVAAGTACHVPSLPLPSPLRPSPPPPDLPAQPAHATLHRWAGASARRFRAAATAGQGRKRRVLYRSPEHRGRKSPGRSGVKSCTGELQGGGGERARAPGRIPGQGAAGEHAGGRAVRRTARGGRGRGAHAQRGVWHAFGGAGRWAMRGGGQPAGRGLPARDRRRQSFKGGRQVRAGGAERRHRPRCAATGCSRGAPSRRAGCHGDRWQRCRRCKCCWGVATQGADWSLRRGEGGLIARLPP